MRWVYWNGNDKADAITACVVAKQQTMWDKGHFAAVIRIDDDIPEEDGVARSIDVLQADASGCDERSLPDK